MFKPGQRIEWDTRDGVEKGTVLDIFDKAKNPHLKHDSYLVQMDFNGLAMTVPIKSPLRKERQ